MANVFFGAIGCLGGIFTHHYAIMVLCYYCFAEMWKYPCFLITLLTFPLMIMSFFVFAWRAIRLESVSFPAMAMFSNYYCLMGISYAVGIVL